MVKFANRTQDLEERTIKLTKCDTINPLTSSTRNCSPNFVKRVRMFGLLERLEYIGISLEAGTLSIVPVQYRDGYWIIDLYLKSLNFEIIEKVQCISD